MTLSAADFSCVFNKHQNYSRKKKSTFCSKDGWTPDSSKKLRGISLWSYSGLRWSTSWGEKSCKLFPVSTRMLLLVPQNEMLRGRWSNYFQSIFGKIHREWWKLRKAHNHRRCERSLPYSYKDLTKEPFQSCTSEKRSVLVDTKPCGDWRESVLFDYFNNRAALVISGYLSKWLVESAFPSDKP